MENPDRPGWYDDPEHSEQLRYFDGVVWTSHTTPRRTRWDQPAQRGESAGGESGEGEYVGLEGTRRPGGRAGQAPQGGGSRHDSPGPGSPGQGQVPPGWSGGPRQDEGQGSDRPGYGPPGYGPPGPGQPGYGRPGARPVPTTADGVPLASYGRRVVAYIVDQIIQGFLTFVVGAYWSVPLVRDSMDQMNTAIANGDESGVLAAALDQTLTQYLVPLTLVSVGVMLVYNAVFLSRLAATPGKLLIGISVRRVEHPGPISVTDAFRRYALQSAMTIGGLIPLLDLTTLLVTVADLLWPLRDPRRQALHDKIADTQVVLGRPPVQPSVSGPGGPAR
jgi:uncharacterized RDD family membrane protein YckC